MRNDKIAQTMCSLITGNNKYLNMTKAALEKELRPVSTKLIEKWNARKDDNDCSIYFGKGYFVETILCWTMLTLNSYNGMKRFMKANKESLDSMTIFDDYNGCGITTIKMVQDGYKSVKYFNDTDYQVAAMNEYCDSINMKMPKHAECGKGRYDIVCSFEVLEHCKNPMPRVKQYIKMANKYLIISTGFGNHSWAGHFETYSIKGVERTARDTKKAILSLIDKEFDLVHRGFNEKPMIYKRRQL